MGWLSGKAKRPRSDAVREALFSAVLRGDEQEFHRLCEGAASVIMKSFGEWQRIPKGVRENPKAVDAWAHCLVTIASAFDAAGRPELMEMLTGGGDNSINRWNSACERAQRLSEDGRYAASSRILENIVEEMHGTIGNAIDELRPKVYGQLGTNYFHSGDLAAARRYTLLALEECERTGDQDGVAVYTENLATLAAREDGPTATCRRTIAQAQRLSDGMQYEYSNALLQGVLSDIEQTPALRSFRAKVHGLMGSNHYQVRDFENALMSTEAAMLDCEANGDAKGTRIYRENLRVIRRASCDG